MKPRMLMKDSVFEELITQLKGCSFKFKEINMHGVGEPLMNKNILKMIEQVKGANVGEKITMSTNGILMSPDKFEALASTGLDEVVVSLDTVDSDRYQEIKGKPMRNLLENIDFAIQYVQKTRSIHLVIKCFEPRDTYGLSTKDSDQIIAKYGDTAANSEFIHIKIVPEWTWPIQAGKNEKTDHSPCEIPFYQLNVHADGRVSCCCLDIRHELSVGQINPGGSLNDILFGPQLKSIQMDMLSGNLKNLPGCLKCDNRPMSKLTSEPKKMMNIVSERNVK